jgi:HSP20 family protein
MSLFQLKHSLPISAPGLSLWPENDLDRFFNAPIPIGTGQLEATDLYETDDELVLEMAVPGLSGDEIDVSAVGRKLKIQATTPKKDNEGRRYCYREINHGVASRTFDLPTSVNLDAISARVENGLLTVKMPKASEAKVKKIVISN